MSSQTTNLELIKPAYTDTADIGDINDNMDSLDTAVSGKKDKQTVVTDPTASGTALTFIDTLSQNANGVITPTKKSVKGMVGATSSANGAAGLVTQPLIADKDKFLKGDGTWATPSSQTYNEATSSNYGLVKIGYTQSGKNYPVQLSSGKMYVNVPWTDNNTTYSQASSSALGLVKIGYSQNGKNYPVVLDGNGKMYVNVPWTDNNTTYSNFGGTNGTTAGSAGLVPAPATQYRYAALIGEGHWCSLQDILNVTNAHASSSINSSNQKIEFRLGNQDNVSAINSEVSVSFSPAFTTGCHIVIPVLRSNLNGVYNRFTVYDWGKTGFKYKVQNGSTANVSFTWFAIGY